MPLHPGRASEIRCGAGDCVHAKPHRVEGQYLCECGNVVGSVFGPASQHAAYDAILQARGRLQSWCALADELGEVLTAIGTMWRSGDMSIATEHEITELLGRALAQCASTIPGNPEKRCVLATAPGDPHTLGLSLLEVCIREMGYGSRWLGAGLR